jgi:chromate reductase, NAD(P)H dehydrogenase (quinone)
MSKPRILVFAGSTRRESYNKKLLKIAATGASAANADVTVLDLRDYPMPLFDEDLEKESGAPDSAVKLKKLFLEHDGLLIASPEYNSSITAVLKNTIDWVSRSAPGEQALAAYKGKVATILSASPGALGGLRGLVHLRAILGNIGVIVLPDQIAIPKAHEAFNEDGTLKDPKQQSTVQNLARTLTDVIAKLSTKH